MIKEFFLLTIGLIGLWFGAELLIRSARNIANHFGLSKFFVGLVFVSIGTSIPEIAISVIGGLDRLAGIETSGIVVGNIIGSALTQISLLFGILALIMPLRLKRKVTIQQGMSLIASVLLVYLLASDGFLSRQDGIIVLLAYLAYYIFSWMACSKHRPGAHAKVKFAQDVVYGIAGLVFIWFASDLVIMNGITLATELGVHQSLIGILFVGLGSGLPELSVALTSYRRKAIEISVGDLVGSSICDLLLSLGTGTVISGFIVDPIHLYFDFPVLLAFCFFAIYFLYTGRRLSRKEGFILIALFLVYATIKVLVTG